MPVRTSIGGLSGLSRLKTLARVLDVEHGVENDNGDQGKPEDMRRIDLARSLIGFLIVERMREECPAGYSFRNFESRRRGTRAVSCVACCGGDCA
jgi:hypothetical protein